MALTQITTDGIKDGTITGTDLATNVDLVDNQKLRLGTGNDLQIFHDGNDSLIKDAGTGLLGILTNGFRVNNAANNESMIKADENGAVELYYDNSKKLETTNTGATVTGELRVTDHLVMNAVDNKRIYLGAGNDLQIYHSGFNYIESHNDIEVHINAYTGGAVENMAKFKPNGAVELYHNNTKRLETTSSGVEIPQALFVGEKIDMPDHTSGTNGMILLGTGDDLYMYHDGTNSHLRNNTGTFNIRAGSFRLTDAAIQHVYLKTNDGGNDEIDLYYDNSVKLTTTSSGIDVTGRVTTDELSVIKTSGNLSANFEAQNGLGTLEIGGSTGAFIDLKTPFSDDFDLRIDSSGTLTSKAGMQLNVNGSESGVNVISNGAVELYHNGNRQVFTIDGGMNWQDNKNAEFGNSGDLKIYHSGSNSFIKQTGTGDLYLQCDSGETIFLRPKANEDGIKVINDGAVELYHNNNKKLETTADGAYISDGFWGVGVASRSGTPASRAAFMAIGDTDTGVAQNGDGQLELWANNQEIMNLDTGSITSYKTFLPSANDTHDLGTTSNRWRNIYTQDLQLSNEARKDKGGNDVDGTWGDWTLQEGEEEIFMINNRTGKKYAMMLKEVA